MGMAINKAFYTSIFVCLLLGAYVCSAQEVIRPISRRLATDITPIALIDIPSSGTTAEAVSHKAGATNVEMSMAFTPQGSITPGTDGKRVTITAPEGYTFSSDCLATRMVDSSTGITVTINSTAHTAKGVQVTACVVNSSDSKKCTITLASEPTAQTSNNMIAVTFVAETTPVLAPQGDWSVEFDGANGNPVTNWARASIDAVGGWVAGLASPTNAIGTPHASKISLRPTTLEEMQNVSVGIYFSITNEIDAGGGIAIELPGLVYAKPGDCQISQDISVCPGNGGTCVDRDVGTLSGVTIDGTEEIGCHATAMSLQLITRNDIAANSGVFIRFIGRTAEVLGATVSLRGHIMTCPRRNLELCPVVTHFEYLTSDAHRDYGVFAEDVTVNDGAFSMGVSMLLIAIIMVVS